MGGVLHGAGVPVEGSRFGGYHVLSHGIRRPLVCVRAVSSANKVRSDNNMSIVILWLL